MANSDQVTANLQYQRQQADLAAQYPSSGRPGDELLRASADQTPTNDLQVGGDVNGTQIPTDPAQFQQYLNDHGANPPLQVDGIIGPLTLQAAAQLGVAVPNAVVTHELSVGPDVVDGPGEGTSSGASSGGGGGASGGGSFSAPSAIPGSDDDVRAKFGAYAWALDIPQVGDALRRAASEGWSPTQLQAAIEQTDWWRTTSSSMRAWQEMSQDDPNSAEAKIAKAQSDIGVQAATLGIDISSDRQRQIAIDSIRLGWDSTQLQQAMASEFKYKPGGQTGSLGAAEGDLRALAHQYGVDDLLDDGTLSSYEMQIARGVATASTFRQQFVQQAQQRYPGIAGQITTTNPTTNALAPYRNAAANELGVTPDSIDFSQPKWNRAVNQIDPKTGVAMPMSLYDWQRTVRSDDSYGWQHTKNGQDAAYQFQHNFLAAIDKAPA